MSLNHYLAFVNLRKDKKKFNFDSQIYSIKNKVLIFSSIIIASTFVSPTEDGAYEVNMLIIKGSLKEPELLFIFLGLVGLYYIVWLYFHSRRIIVEQYQNLQYSFTYSLACSEAHKKFVHARQLAGENELTYKKFEKLNLTGTVCKVKVSISSNTFDRKPELADVLKKASFELKQEGNLTSVIYTYNMQEDDFKFMKYYRDFCLIIRFDESFVFLIPFLYGIIAELILFVHIYSLWMNKG